MIVKDLRVLNRDLKNVILVDDCIASFANNINNGVPILPFMGDAKDKELLKLLDFLMETANVADVRQALSEKYKLSKLMNSKIENFMSLYKTVDQDNNFISRRYSDTSLLDDLKQIRLYFDKLPVEIKH